MQAVGNDCLFVWIERGIWWGGYNLCELECRKLMGEADEDRLEVWAVESDASQLDGLQRGEPVVGKCEGSKQHMRFSGRFCDVDREQLRQRGKEASEHVAKAGMELQVCAPVSLTRDRADEPMDGGQIGVWCYLRGINIRDGEAVGRGSSESGLSVAARGNGCPEGRGG